MGVFQIFYYLFIHLFIYLFIYLFIFALSQDFGPIERQSYKIHRILSTSMEVSTAPISVIDCGNDELVAVDDSIDVGNVLYIIYDSLCY